MRSRLVPWFLVTLFLSLRMSVAMGDHCLMGRKTNKDAEDNDICSLHHPVTGEFYSLHDLERTNVSEKGDYNINGFDYGYNFSMNLCNTIVNDVSNFTIVGNIPASNIGAYYIDREENLYSLGSVREKPVFRGRKLVMQFNNGSLCPGSRTIRKSALLSFTCNRDPYTQSGISYIGNLNECAYFFEWKTMIACPTGRKDSSMGPFGVFGVLTCIGLVAYLVGGCVYQRVVMRATGLQQIPNFDMWYSIFSFVKDMSIAIVASLCTFISAILPFKRWRARNNLGFYHRTEDSLIDDIDEV
ncbi:cation dependent mannose-6-phosphate cargo receptor [Schizosaccharomyces japonicus yFS275]|uniref:Cation dependent mannose-6-phosphate cargo receptor n=1 Tax=Schizosaccharomyces japonicus (strain yFS275 / FY16936) TaxID=402676 RepID=B6JZK9_SCHJY|nr:cation dependent mannose-6-phosphate cargo receptor [Schizosaccharomyces japonicus yFS275]EEB06977.1 cation dependent mannose-6-phosphate cargo receptor [Schizosaccharomyces japonicus yFS275]